MNKESLPEILNLMDNDILKISDICQDFDPIKEEVGLENIKKAIYGLTGRLEQNMLTCLEKLQLPKKEYIEKRNRRLNDKPPNKKT